MEEVAFPMASSLVVHREKQPEATLHEIARSSPRAVRVTGDAVDLRPVPAVEAAPGPRAPW